MKKFLVFTAVLLSSVSKTFACGYSPYGEDIRYSLFLPGYFNCHDFSAFHYSSQLFGFDFEYQNKYESNVYDWYYFTGKKVSLDEINECMNVLTLTDINADSKNEFVHFLYLNNMGNVVNYLKMAKKCEAINTLSFDDAWERDASNSDKLQLTFLKELEKAIVNEKNSYLKRKYAFLAIRTYYYTDHRDSIAKLFDAHFRFGKKDYLYYWSLFFNSFGRTDVSMDVANIMAYSPEKKYAAYYYFHNDFSLQKALAKAENKQEIANAYAYASVQKISPNLEYLTKIYDNSFKSKILDFLLLREINKIEDWVYTPYYTNYLPSIEFANSWYKEGVMESTNTLRSRSEKDRLYAQEVLNFVNAADLSKIDNPVLWKASQIQLLFITKNYNECLNKIQEFKKNHAKEKVFPQIEKIEALSITANQDLGKAIIKDEIKSIILKYRNDERFLFSLGRELEFRGNIPDGIALISLGNSLPERISNYGEDSSGVDWQGNRLKDSGNLKYFYEYFDYLDFVYTAKEMQLVINKVNRNEATHDDFEKVIYGQLLKDKNQLTDLLGTKYIRENRLIAAELAFRSIGEKYWNDNYNAWERDEYGDYYSFEENPFYDFKYTESFIPHRDKYLVTKLSVTQHLIKYLKLANNPKTKDRDYYYFIVANCYANMSKYGHSWMMRRFESTSYFDDDILDYSYVDEAEYHNCKLAQQYYQLAYDNAKTDKFRALCLRMIDFFSKEGVGFVKLRSQYPEFYSELSNCEHLEDYFKAR